MEKGFLHARIRNHAQNSALLMLLFTAFAGAFVGVGVEGYLDGEFSIVAVIVIGGIATAVGLFTLRAAVGQVRIWLDPSRSDAFAALARYGDPREILVEIEVEIAGGNEAWGPVQFTEHWMVCTGDVDVHVCRPEEVNSVRHEVKQHRKYGVPVRKSHTLKLTTDHEEFDLKVQAGQVENIVLCIRERNGGRDLEFFPA